MKMNLNFVQILQAGSAVLQAIAQEDTEKAMDKRFHRLFLCSCDSLKFHIIRLGTDFGTTYY